MGVFARLGHQEKRRRKSGLYLAWVLCAPSPTAEDIDD
jgi:hypothetical protein